MATPGSPELHVDELLHVAQGFIDDSVTAFHESIEMKEMVFGPSGETTDDATDTDNGMLFKNFKRLPLEIRSQIWLAAAEAVMPCGVYHFTFNSKVMRPGPTYPDLCDTVLANLHRLPPGSPLSQPIHDLLMWAYDGLRLTTFTPSAAVASLTREMRDLFRSCSEARAELMRSPKMSSSFDFHYLKGGKCNLGTIRPFLYETDWVSMDGPESHPSAPGVFGERCTPDIKRIQHFAFPYDTDLRPGKLYKRPAMSHAMTAYGLDKLAIFRWLESLKSVGLYAPSVSIKRVAHWDNVIPQVDRLFLKGIPVPKPGPASTPSWRARDYRAAMKKLQNLMWVMGNVGLRRTIEQKKWNGWPGSNPDFAALQFCFIIHADSREGLDLTKFNEDGSHLADVDLDDLGSMGAGLKQSRLTANISL